MDNGEIIRTYKAAKNRKQQVKILADLNQCKVEDIIEILKTDKQIDQRAFQWARAARGKRNTHTSESAQNTPELTVGKAIQVIKEELVSRQKAIQGAKQAYDDLILILRGVINEGNEL